MSRQITDEMLAAAYDATAAQLNEPARWATASHAVKRTPALMRDILEHVHTWGSLSSITDWDLARATKDTAAQLGLGGFTRWTEDAQTEADLRPIERHFLALATNLLDQVRESLAVAR